MTKVSANPTPKSAISFSVPTALWRRFHARTDALFLARAPFLDHVISRELPYLSEDLSGYRMSTRSKRYVSGELRREDVTSVNIEVRPATAIGVRETLQAHNLVRDAFLTRLVALLYGSDRLLEVLGVPRRTGDIRGGAKLEDMPTSPLAAMEAVRDDPLFYLRSVVRDQHGVGLYRVDLPFVGMATYLADSNTPGSRQFRAQERALSALLDDPVSKPKTARRPAAGGRR